MISPSYWQATSYTFDTGTDAPTRTCDVAVIGAGLLGVSAAYFLARQGVDVVVLERDAVGSGATARNAGFVVSGTAVPYPVAVAQYGHSTARAVWQFTLDNRALVRTVLSEEGIACDYREPGHLSLATSESELALLAETTRLLREDGFESVMLDRRQLEQMLPFRLSPAVLGGRFSPAEGQLHSANFVGGLARAASERGARFACGWQAHSLHRQGSQWSVLLDGRNMRRSITAERVICATNAWLGGLLPQLADVITPVRGQVLATQPLPPLLPCAMSADEGYQYWQQVPDGRIVLGGCRPAAADHEIGYTDPVTRDEVQAALSSYLHTMFLDLPPFAVEHRWAGIMAFSRDTLPLIGKVPDMDGVFVAGGFTGHGMPFGLRAGELLAQSCVDGTVTPKLEPFRLDRPSLAIH